MLLKDMNNLEYCLINNDSDYIDIYKSLKDNAMNLLSLCFIDNEYRLYLGFHDDCFYNDFEGYVKLFLLNYNNLKLMPGYKTMEEATIELCNELNVDYDFKSVFKESFSNWISCYYMEYDLDDTYCPERYFEYIIKNSSIDLKEGFNMASIDFLKVNKKDKISGKILLSESEKILKLFGIEKIALQLLNPKLKDYYKRYDYIELKTVEAKCDAEFMYKDIKLSYSI